MRILVALSAAVALTASCAIRLDKKRILKKVSEYSGRTLIGRGVYVSKDTVVAPFTSLVVSPGYSDMELIQDTCTYVSVYGCDNIIPFVSITSEDGSLTVGCDFSFHNIHNDEKGNANVKVTVHTPSIDSIRVENVGGFVCKNLDLAGRPLSIVVNGRADLDLGNVESSALSVECNGESSVKFGSVRIAGNSEIVIAGRSDVDFGKMWASSLDVDCSGSASLSSDYVTAGRICLTMTGSSESEMEQVNVENLNVDVSGRGNAELDNMVSSEVNVTVSGSGSVSLDGRAVKAEYSVSGSGEIDAEDLDCGNTAPTVSGRGVIRYRDADGQVVKKRQ